MYDVLSQRREVETIPISRLLYAFQLNENNIG